MAGTGYWRVVEGGGIAVAVFKTSKPELRRYRLVRFYREVGMPIFDEDTVLKEEVLNHVRNKIAFVKAERYAGL